MELFAVFIATVTHRDEPGYEVSRSDRRAAIEPLLTVAGVGEILGVSRPTVYRLIRSGELAVVHVRRRKRFRPEDVRRFLSRSERSYPTGDEEEVVREPIGPRA
jgi:excisionase family DNA binding protein